jgi:hypothetical protein
VSPAGLIGIENAAPDVSPLEERTTRPIFDGRTRTTELVFGREACGPLSRRFVNSAYAAARRTSSRPTRNISLLHTPKIDEWPLR